MSENLTPVPTDPAILEKRAENRKIVEQYLAIKGARSVDERMALMAWDIMYEIVFTMDCRPERTCGADRVRARFEENAKIWDEFEYNNIKIWGTEDPETFVVECDADGTIDSPMYREPRPYHNYYYIVFTLMDGKIWQLRQFTNPFKLIHDFWKDQPTFCR